MADGDLYVLVDGAGGGGGDPVIEYRDRYVEGGSPGRLAEGVPGRLAHVRAPGVSPGTPGRGIGGGTTGIPEGGGEV